MTEPHPATAYATSTANGPYPIPWLCQSGHILGLVVRHNRIMRLELFWVALHELVDPKSTAPLIHATLTGTAVITCSICGRTRTWFAPEEGMRELLERRTE